MTSDTRSQCKRLLDYLATGKEITPLQALDRWGIYRLGARIFDLRQQGHDIRSRLVVGRKRFAAYRLTR